MRRLERRRQVYTKRGALPERDSLIIELTGCGIPRDRDQMRGLVSYGVLKMIPRFEGKVVIVTGAGSGIGAATAKRFHAEGAIVALNGRRESRLTELGAALGNDRYMVVPGDVSVAADVEKLVSG